MNPEWGTPPGGDFARYVEQLTARALAASSHPATLLDDETPAPPVAARVLGRPRPVAAPEAEKKPDAAAPKRSNAALKLLVGWAVVVALFTAGRPWLALLVLFAGALWFVLSRFKGMLADFAGRAKTEAQRRQQAAGGRFPS